MARESADRMTDEENAAITAAALADPDNPPLTEEFWKRARPMSPERLRRLRGQCGPQRAKRVKQRVLLRLDPDIVAHFKKRGPGWQSRPNATLRKALKLPKLAQKGRARDAEALAEPKAHGPGQRRAAWRARAPTG